MLVGSQLKNAQLEVVADTLSLPATDNVKGRIVYVVDQAQLYLYDGAWKALYTKEDVDAAIAAVTAAHIAADDVVNDARIAGDNAVENSITTGVTNLIGNKTPPQEMSHTWNLNGRVPLKEFDSIDGNWTAPFDCEVTGFAVSALYAGGSSQYIEISLRCLPLIGSDSGTEMFSTNCKLYGSTNILSSYNPSLHVSYLNEATGVVEVSNAEGNAGVGVNSAKENSSSVYPVWDSDWGSSVSMDNITRGAVIWCDVDFTNSNNSSTFDSNIAVTLFFRRKNFT